MKANIRKLVVQVDEIRIEMGKPVVPPTRRAVAIAVIANPCAGRYVDNLDELIEIGAELGKLLGEKCVAALGITPAQAESYGKAAIVGEARGAHDDLAGHLGRLGAGRGCEGQSHNGGYTDHGAESGIKGLHDPSWRRQARRRYRCV